MKLREYREGYGITQADCARALGMSAGHFSHLEAATMPFTMEIAMRIEIWSMGSVPALSMLDKESSNLLAIFLFGQKIGYGEAGPPELAPLRKYGRSGGRPLSKAPGLPTHLTPRQDQAEA